MSVISYKCKNCSAPLEHNIDTQKWDCKYCLSSYSLNELEGESTPQPPEEEAPKAEAPKEEYSGSETAVFECPSCGGRILTEKQTAATFCVYCHNTAIIETNLKGEYKPHYIIPFKITKEKALEQIKKYCAKKPLLPKMFTDILNKGEISGLYVPYRLYDCDMDAKFRATGKRITVWKSGNYDYKKTDTYRIIRDAQININRLPVDASSKMDDNLMQAIEPFKYSEIKDFSMHYLSGHFADTYDIGEDKTQLDLKKRVNREIDSVMRTKVGYYNTIITDNIDIDYKNTAFSYAMFPVWTLMYTYKKKDYKFLLNAQTGKVAGALPVDFKKLAKISGIVWAASFVLICILGLF